MWECSYAREPLNLKLVVLRLLQTIWIPLAAALGGALIWGIGYYIGNVALAGPPLYEMTSIYYVDYGTAPLTDNAFTYINAYTWNEWVRTDEFTDGVTERIQDEGYGLSGEEIKGYVSADLPSDLRMPYSKVATPDPQLTLALGKALEQAFVEFGERQREIVSIRVSDSGSVTRAAMDDRTLRAMVLGALLGFFAALTVLLIRFIADSSVRIPETFSYRYGIPALGILYKNRPAGKNKKAGERNGAEKEILSENLQYVLRGKKKIALIAVEADADLQEETAQISDVGNGRDREEYICVPSPAQCPEAAQRLREADGVLLLVRAGAHNGKQIESVLDFMKIQEITVDGALLYDGDEWLNRAYRLPGLTGGRIRRGTEKQNAEEGKDR